MKILIQKKMQIIDRVNDNSLIICSRGECIVVVQSLSCVWFFLVPWTAACQPSLSFTISWSLLSLMYTKSMMPSNHLILCHSLLLLPSTFPSIRVFSNESALCIMWPKYWSFSFSFSFSVSINPSSEYSGLISFRTDWFDLAKGLSRLFSSISLKASVFWHSAFFMVHFSHPYMITRKTIALTTQIFVGKVMSLLFNTVWVCPGFSSKEQESFHFMAAVTGGSQENKISHCFHFFPIYLPWSDGMGCPDISFSNVTF